MFFHWKKRPSYVMTYICVELIGSMRDKIFASRHVFPLLYPHKMFDRIQSLLQRGQSQQLFNGHALSHINSRNLQLKRKLYHSKSHLILENPTTLFSGNETSID